MNSLDILSDILNDTLTREFHTITIDNTVHSVFFRRNEKGDMPYTTMFCSVLDSINQGAEFTYNNHHYIITKQLTDENSIYRKYQCLRCNNTITIMFAKGDTVVYNVYMNNLSDSLNISNGAITTDSNVEIILSLTTASRRLDTNRRFFCGSYNSAWVVNEMNYTNGAVHLYCGRSAIMPTDDAVNGIANRWSYEHKPDNYVISITPVTVSLNTASTNTQALTVSVSKNGTVMAQQPTCDWIVSSDCVTVANNTITAVKGGSATITANYMPYDNDTCTSDTVNCSVTESHIYTVDITNSDLTLETPNTSTLTVKLLKDGVEQTYTDSDISISVADTSVATINGYTVHSVANGSTTITATYVGTHTESDIINSDTINLTVTEPQVVDTITVIPTISELYEGDSQVFTCSTTKGETVLCTPNWTGSQFTLTQVSGGWKLTCNSQADPVLKLTFSYGSCTPVVMSISLNSLL